MFCEDSVPGGCVIVLQGKLSQAHSATIYTELTESIVPTREKDGVLRGREIGDVLLGRMAVLCAYT